MITEPGQVFCFLGVFVVLVSICGLYYILATFNLIRVVIGVELLIKAVTLLIISAGYVTGKTGLAQSLVITLIVIEVAIMVVAGGVILCIYRQYQNIDTRNLNKMKG